MKLVKNEGEVIELALQDASDDPTADPIFIGYDRNGDMWWVELVTGPRSQPVPLPSLL